MLENWKKGYFNGQNDVVNASNTGLQIVVPNKDIVQQTGGSSSRKKVSKYWKMVKVAFTLIVSAIFGDPTAVTVTLIKLLFSK